MALLLSGSLPAAAISGTPARQTTADAPSVETAADERAATDTSEQPRFNWLSRTRFSLFGGVWSRLDSLADRLGPDLGLSSFEVGGSDADGEAVGVGVTLVLTRRWRLETSVFSGTAERRRRLRLDRQFDGTVTTNLDLLGADLAARYGLRPEGRLRPWTEVGLRAFSLDVDDIVGEVEGDRIDVVAASDADVLEGFFGVGVDWHLGGGWVLGAEAGYGIDSHLWTGVSAAFDFTDIAPWSPMWSRVEAGRSARIDLDVDTDRNGCVDVELDDDGEHTFGPSRGAIVLANIDDDDGDGTPDADDAIVNGDRDAEDLAPLQLRKTPGGEILGTRYFLRIRKDLRHSIRIFWQGTPVLGPGVGVERGDYLLWKIPNQNLSRGLQLDLEALRHPTREFSGIIRIEAVGRLFFSGADEVLDTVQLRVAPWIMSHHLQPTEVVYVGNPGGSAERTAMVDRLARIITELSTSTGPAPPLLELVGKSFPQDHDEIGYSVAPARSAPACSTYERHQMAVSVESPEWRSSFSKRGPDQAVIDSIPSGGDPFLNFFGNLEVTPPLDGWPLGRIYYGTFKKRRLSPDLQAFLKAQQVQAPLELDSSWLALGHMDEFVSFVPNPDPGPNEKPFKVLIASPALALAEVVGRGPQLGCTDYSADVDTLLGWQSANLEWQVKIDAVRQIMKGALGLVDEDFIEIPVIYQPQAYGRALAYIANPVNLLVINRHLVIPYPCPRWFDTSIRQRLEAIGYREGRVDDGFSFIDSTSLKAGDIHCGTNSKRFLPDFPWWRME